MYLPENYISEKLKYKTITNNKNFVLGTCAILPESDYKIHKHKISETYIITEGTGEIYVNDHWRSVKKGDVIVFKSDVWHCCKTSNPKGIKLVYFFNTGPFNTIEYIYQSKL